MKISSTPLLQKPYTRKSKFSPKYNLSIFLRECATKEEFEHARDRIIMGIERKKLSMTEKERLNTAIHEAGHAIAGYFNKNAMDLYKATIVARGGALGVTFFVPDESAETSSNKA